MQHQQHLQINVGHLKTEIVKKLGAEKSKLYFFYLNRFLSVKITKVEFNKICFRVLGRENIALHNQLITSILRNAYHAKAPPEVHGSEVCKPLDAAGESGDYNFIAPRDELQQSSTCKDQAQTFNSSLLSNGSILQPPYKVQSGSHERTKGAFPTPAGGKTDILSSSSKEVADLSYVGVLENGSANISTIGKLTHHHRVLPERTGNRGEAVLQDPNRFPVIPGSQDDQSHVRISDSKIASAEDRTEASTRRLLQAPLGVPLCAVSTGGARRALALTSSGGSLSSYDCGGLLDSVTLGHYMEQIAMNEGLQGVSLDCSNMLNNALDSYLKRLIGSSIELVGKGSGSDAHLNMTYETPLQSRFWPSNQSQLQSSSRPIDGILQEKRPLHNVSLLDFRVAMELKPQQLGEDWPLLLEKMSFYSHKD